MGMEVLAVVTAFNQDDVISDTVSSLLNIDEIDRVVVVDDASSDNTAIKAIEAGGDLVVNGENLGKGNSLNRVLPLLDFDILLLIDGDLGRSAHRATSILRPVLNGEADLAIAAFPPPAVKGGFGIAQGLGRWGIKSLTGMSTKSPLSGQRAITRELLRSIEPLEPGFGVEVGMTVDAIRAGFRVVEVGTEMSHDETMRDLAGFLHRGRQFYWISRAVATRVLGARKY